MTATVLPQSRTPVAGSLIPLATTIRAAKRHVSSGLVGPAAWALLDRLTNQLPAALTRRLYFECRLAHAAPQVDLVLCVDETTRTLLTQAKRGWLPAHVRDHTIWRGLATLCTEWDGGPLGRAIYDVWLEFDAEQLPSVPDLLVPSVFVGLARTATTTPRTACESGIAAIEMLTGRCMQPSIAAAVRRVIDALPPTAYVPYIGTMFPRDESAIRLCLGPIAGAGLREYLTRIGWNGPVDDLESLLRSMPSGSHTAFDVTSLLHIDLRDGIQPRIGLEIPLAQHPQVVGGIAERSLFEALRVDPRCAAGKIDAVGQWPGHAVEALPHQCWRSLALRRVSHVKVVYDPANGPVFKTYLSFFHQATQRIDRRQEAPRP